MIREDHQPNHQPHQELTAAFADMARHDEMMDKWIPNWDKLIIKNNKFLLPKKNIDIAIKNPPKTLNHAMFFSEESGELLFSLHDSNNQTLGIIRVPNIENSSYVADIEENLDFFEKTEVCFVRDLDQQEFHKFLQEFSSFFGKKSKFIQNLPFPIPPQLIPTEMMFQFWKLDKMADEEKFQRSALYHILEKNGIYATLILFWGFDSWEEFELFDNIGKNDPEHGHQLIEKFINLRGMADEIEVSLDSTHKRKIHHHFVKLILGVFKAAIQNHDDPDFSPDLSIIALDSLSRLLDYTFQREPSKENTLDSNDLKKADQYLQEKADDPNAVTLFKALIESLLFEQTKSTEEFITQSKKFYITLGETLALVASEITGDTDKEIAFLEEIFLQLATILPENYTWLEAGCGSGRILRLLFEKLKKRNIAPNLCLAIDRTEHKLPEEVPYVFFKKDLAEPEPLLPPEITKPSIITAEWSVINDNPPIEQQKILINLSKAMEIGGILVLEFPTHEHYQQKVDQTGYLEKEFLVEDPKTKQKKKATIPATITRTGILNGYAKIAGFYPVSTDKISVPGMKNGILKYRTKQGQERAFMILEKVAEPTSSYALLLDQK